MNKNYGMEKELLIKIIYALKYKPQELFKCSKFCNFANRRTITLKQTAIYIGINWLSKIESCRFYLKRIVVKQVFALY